MSFVAIVTLILVGLLVAVLAAYLVAIALILKHVNFTLGTVIVGVRAIARQVEPVNPLVEEINADLTGVKEALEGLLAKKQAAANPQPAGTARSRSAGGRS
jgi:hypothetical protein